MKILASAEWQQKHAQVNLRRLRRWLDSRTGEYMLKHRVIYNTNVDVFLEVYDAQPGEQEQLMKLGMYID